MHYKELKEVWAELTGPAGPFEIEMVDIRGQKLRAYKNAPASVRDLWLSTTQFAERKYLAYEGEHVTYGEAHQQVAAIANWLVAQGVKRGDRVAIGMRNYPEWMLIYWACACLGVASVGINAWWVPEELAYALKDSAPKIIFADQERLDRMLSRDDIVGDAQLVGVRVDHLPAGAVAFADVLATGGDLPDADIDPDDDNSIFYTSGTTGFPKGAQLTHRGCIANLMSMQFAGQCSALATLRANGEAPDPDAPAPIPVTLVTTPLFHVTANNCGAYATTAAGGTMVMMYKWDAGEALRLIEEEKITSMSGVPTMAREVLTHPDFAKRDTSSLLSLAGGGAQVPPDLVGKIDEAVATARPSTGYGMTETCGIITSVSGDFFVDKPDTAGPAMPVYEYKCVDDDGNSVPLGENGELWVRGSQVIKGYINRPDATAQSITDGWLHTGDIASLDENGFIFIRDRKKDMVIRGGENVYCAEVEGTIYRHEAVAEVCVFGVPDERLGEEVAAAVVLRPDQTLDAEALRQHCLSLAAKHKVPRYIWFQAEALPRNASGKFLRRELRDALKLEESA